MTGPITTRGIVDITNHVRAEFLGHPDPPVGEQGRPNWRASGLAFCRVGQLLWRSGVAPTRIESLEDRANKHRRFQRGLRIEQEVVADIEQAGLLLASQLHLHDRELEVAGNADVLWGGEVQTELPSRSRWWSPEYAWAVRTVRERVAEATKNAPVPVTLTEVKSSHSFAVRKMSSEGPAPWYRSQLGCYALIIGRHPEQVPAATIERFEFTVWGSDGARPLVFGLDPADIAKAEERLGTLNEAWHSGNWPSCECGKTPRMEWEAARCDYLDPDDPSKCCGKTLLDKLTESVEATAPKQGTLA